MNLSKLFLSGIFLLFFLSAFFYNKVTIPRGDEIHYLITTLSLVNDHDLWLENNYDNKDYAQWFVGELDRHSVKGPDGHEYLYHGLGIFQFLFIPGFLIAGRLGVSLSLAGISCILIFLLYSFIKQKTKSAKAAIISILSAFCSLPLFHYSFLLFPEMVAGSLIFGGFILLTNKKPPIVLTSVIIGLLPWIHLRFLPLSILYTFVLLIKTGKKASVLSILFIFLYFVFLKSIYGSINPLHPYILLGIPTNSGNIVVNLINIFFDRQYGLLFHAPIYLFALPGMILWYQKNKTAFMLIFVTIAVYFFTVFRYYDWNGGFSPPARYLVPILPLLIPAIAYFVHKQKNIVWKFVIFSFIMWSIIVTILNTTSAPNWGFIYMDGFAPYLHRISLFISIAFSDLLPVYYPEKSLTAFHLIWIVIIGIFEIIAIQSIKSLSHGREKK